MRTPFAVGIASLALILVGCSAGDHYSASAAQQLQQTTLELAGSAQARDYAAALQQLTALEQETDAALQRGEIGQARHDAIASAITSVRGDLLQLQAAAQQTALQQQLDRLQQLQQSTQPPKHDNGNKDKGGGGD